MYKLHCIVPHPAALSHTAQGCCTLHFLGMLTLCTEQNSCLSHAFLYCFVAACHLSHDWLEPVGNAVKIFQSYKLFHFCSAALQITASMVLNPASDALPANKIN